MPIRIPMDVTTLATSRFAMSPAIEIVATLRARTSPGQPVHARHWNARARARLDPATLELLHALVPADHPYAPDFLVPHPVQPRETKERMVAAIASTPVDQVARELDFVFDGRPVHPEFAETFGGTKQYTAWRRRVSPRLHRLLTAGEATVAAEAALAFGRFFDAVLAPDWARVTAVLDADVAHRSEVTAERGLAAMLETLGQGLSWDGEALTLDRPYDVVVDWADDGLLFTPSAAHSGPVLFSAERFRTPTLTYPARGTGPLGFPTREEEHSRRLGDLISKTRVNILQLLDDPRTTQALSQLDGHSTATISHHLAVLKGGRLVTSRRSGRGVVYSRTALGDALISGEFLIE